MGGKPRRTPLSVAARKAAQRWSKSGVWMSDADRRRVDEWCKRMADLLALRESSKVQWHPISDHLMEVRTAPNDVFDSQLLAAIESLEGFSVLDAILEQHYEGLIGALACWLVGVLEQQELDEASFRDKLDEIASQTARQFGRIGVTAASTRSALLHDDVRHARSVKGGKVQAAVLATREAIPGDGFLGRVTSVRKIFRIYARHKEDFAVIQRGGRCAGTPGLLDEVRSLRPTPGDGAEEPEE